MNSSTTTCINGTLQRGDLVISAPNEDYPCLIGRVLEINLLGTPEHAAETENDTDDVHVGFMEFDYSKQRVKEIEATFSELYGMKKKFADCPIDDTIMAPESLIRITGIENNRLDYLLESGYNAACYCYEILSGLTRHAKTESGQAEDERSAILSDIFDTIESSITLAGYKVMDGDRERLIVRHGNSDTDFEIKVNELS